jgi:hypothetical protein
MIVVVEVRLFFCSIGFCAALGLLVCQAMRPLRKSLPKRPPHGWRRKRFAAATGGFGPVGTGGAAAWLGSGAQRPDRHVACNIIVGPYCVSFQTGGL